jgi:peptide deformylase
MALRKIALQGEPCLTKVCRPVTDFNGRLHTLLDDLADTLADSGGVGLAAPQVGVLRRVCVVLDEEDQLIELVNPEIIRTEGEQTGLEGCLSVPGKYGEVTRPEIVRVRAQDRNGDWFEVEDEGLTARCFCHEIEHLDGHLFVEHTDHLLTEEELEAYIRQCEAENGDEDE